MTACTVFLYRVFSATRSKMLVGYARVSATRQNLDRQLALLKAADCKRVFREIGPRGHEAARA